MKKTPQLYDIENEARKQIEFSSRALPEVKIGQIRWYYVGINIGQEISKGAPYLRPCIVIKKYRGSSQIRIAPLTTRSPNKDLYFIAIKNAQNFRLKKSRISLKNIGSIDKKRLIKLHHPHLISKKLCKLLLYK